ncbi:hypothetical protein LLE49_23130 [Alicyclobacillus tolerans]|uniref:hypothetical protein n=1 Tax=Alicyclobacillus tolerans TaxID=90970 RepID=UPI001F4667C3|nr:hypothetical protein [Alicyclobacillus tolerans]MCF8567616.1 hypothetical protein [Alicyclobacillus tolerans]
MRKINIDQEIQAIVDHNILIRDTITSLIQGCFGYNKDLFESIRTLMDAGIHGSFKIGVKTGYLMNEAGLTLEDTELVSQTMKQKLRVIPGGISQSKDENEL